MNVITRALVAVKALSTMRWPRSAAWFSMLLGSTTFDYRRSAGDGRTNAAVMACVRWAQRALPEAPLQVVTRNRDGELKPAPEHALQMLFERPNSYYSGLHLLGALLADLMLTGNGYAIKLRSADNRVVQLWWVPSTLMEPRWPDNDPSVFISHYDYSVEGQVVQVDPSEVVHIRQGFDPNNVRKGLSDLTSLYREIATDNEGANWTGSLLRNGAVPGVIISPEGDTSASAADLEDIKEKFQARFGGDQRGAPLVMKGPTKVQVLSFTPEQMNLRAVRQIPEERITAVLGIPAAVVGLGAGLDTTKVGATMREMREQAYESCLIPIQRLIVAELQMQLVKDFGDPAKLRVQFDLSQVRVLQDDQNALHQRARDDLGAGLITLNQALQMIGQEPLSGAEGDVRYLPNTITVKTLDTLIPPKIEDVTPPSDQAALPAPADAGAADQPAKALVAAGARNGHANGKASAVATLEDLGPALVLSESDLDRLSKVGPDDLDNAGRFWRRVTEGSGLEDLIEADPEGE